MNITIGEYRQDTDKRSLRFVQVLEAPGVEPGGKTKIVTVYQRHNNGYAQQQFKPTMISSKALAKWPVVSKADAEAKAGVRLP